MVRDVYKVIAYLNTTIGTGSANIVLHTADVSKTLIRTIIDMAAENSGTAADQIGCRLLILPEDFTAPALGTSHALDDDVPDEIIISHRTRISADGTANHVCKDIYKDLKGMRKLDAGDEIVLQTVSEDTTHKFDGTITMFFKDA